MPPPPAPRGIDRLRLLPLLRDAPLSALQHLERTASQHRLCRGTVLPAPADGVAVDLVVVGQIRLSALAPSGQVLTLEVLGPGEFFVLDGTHARGSGSWLAQARCAATLVYRVPVPVVEAVLADCPALALGALRAQHRRLADAYDRLGEWRYGTLCQRLACTLARLTQVEGPVVTLSHEELGWLAGASRVRVTKSLAALRQVGLLDVVHHPRGVRVLDVAALSRYGQVP